MAGRTKVASPPRDQRCDVYQDSLLACLRPLAPLDEPDLQSFGDDGTFLQQTCHGWS